MADVNYVTSDGERASPGFTSETGRGFDVSDSTNDYQSVLEISDYDFMDAAYNGSGGFKSGNFLVPHQREGYWKARKQVSSYKNYLGAVVDAMVDPVFDGTITRTVADTEGGEHNEQAMFSAFIDNCDNRGNGLSAFMRTATRKARLHGCTFIVMDNFVADMQPDTVEGAIQARIFPYLYLRTPQQIKSFELDDFGRLTKIMICAKPVVTVKAVGKPPVSEERFVEFTDDTVTGYKQDKDDKSKLIVVDERENPIGVIPVIPMYYVPQPVDDLFVMPNLYSLARINHEMYNVSSEMRELQRGQAFAIKYIQADASASVALGANTVLFIPETASIPPGQIAADMGGHAALLEYKKDLVEDFLYISRQNGVVGVETSVSGIAKEWDFRAEEGLLRHTATVAADAEYIIADMFALYSGQQFWFDVQYPDDFAPASEMGILDVLDKYSLMESIPPEGKRMAAVVATRVVFADQSPEKVAEIVAKIESMTDDEIRSEPDGEIDDAETGDETI